MVSIVLLLGFLSMESCQATFYMSTRRSIWNGSDEECMPATPKVGAAKSYSPNAYTVDNLGIDLPDNEDIWVGYYQEEKVFEYIGCVRYYHMFYNTQPKIVSINGDPGHCFPGCRDNTIVGVTKTECFCLGDTFDFQGKRTETVCTHKCNHPAVACGKDNGSMKYSYLSIYKISDKVSPSSISETPSNNTKKLEMNCLNVVPSGPTFYWDRCTLLHSSVICYHAKHVESQKCKSHCSWIDAANACFAKSRFPTLYSNSKDIIRSDDSRLWTGVLKANVTYKRNGNIMAEHAKIQYGYLTKISDNEVHLKFTEADSKKRKLCLKDEDMTTDVSSSSTTSWSSTSDTGFSVTVSTIIAITSVVVLTIIIAVLTVLLMKKRRTNQGTRLAKVRHVSEHTSYITPISDEAGDGAYTTIQDIGPGGASEEIGIQNPQKIVYESLGERNDVEHSYGTANTQRSAYESLGERHDEDHNYGTPNTHRNAYESLGDRHEEEHGYGTPNTQRLAYESLDERHDEEHSYEASVQATSGFNEPLEEEKIDTHNYEIAGRPRELAYDSLGDKEKETHCDGTSHQIANVETYEWVE